MKDKTPPALFYLFALQCLFKMVFACFIAIVIFMKPNSSCKHCILGVFVIKVVL